MVLLNRVLVSIYREGWEVQYLVSSARENSHNKWKLEREAGGRTDFEFGFYLFSVRYGFGAPAQRWQTSRLYGVSGGLIWGSDHSDLGLRMGLGCFRFWLFRVHFFRV